MEPPRPMLHSAHRGGAEVTGQAVRPGRGWCPYAGVGGSTQDEEHAPAMAGPHIPGRVSSYPTLETPQPIPHGARRGGVEVTGQIARPGRGWCAHAGAGGRTLDKQGTPDVSGSNTLGWGRSYLMVEPPRLMPHSVRRGGVEGTGQVARLGPG